MRILLITDSLAMPRENIDIKDTWPSLFINNFKDNNEILTFMQRARDSNQIVQFLDEIKLYKPELIIFQFGIVDCCRRALPTKILKIISHIPLISGITRILLRRYHYKLTQLYDIKRVNPYNFKNNVNKIINETLKYNISIIFIAIAEPGDYLIDTTYNIKKDVELYNDIFDNLTKNRKNVNFINPYIEFLPKDYILEEDGHHLSNFGHIQIFKYLKKIILEMQNE